jgi:hypothetical protein
MQTFGKRHCCHVKSLSICLESGELRNRRPLSTSRNGFASIDGPTCDASAVPQRIAKWLKSIKFIKSNKSIKSVKSIKPVKGQTGLRRTEPTVNVINDRERPGTSAKDGEAVLKGTKDSFWDIEYGTPNWEYDQQRGKVCFCEGSFAATPSKGASCRQSRVLALWVFWR